VKSPPPLKLHSSHRLLPWQTPFPEVHQELILGLRPVVADLQATEEKNI
jgi:hypothetical protein